jgi:hypothetical protein
MENLIHETIEYVYSPQGKATLAKLISENFKQRNLDGLVMLEDLAKDPDQLVGEENYKVKK